MRPTPAESSSTRAVASSETPTRARHVVLGFIVALAIITYIDRVCISQATTDIRRDLGLTEKQGGCRRDSHVDLNYVGDYGVWRLMRINSSCF